MFTLLAEPGRVRKSFSSSRDVQGERRLARMLQSTETGRSNEQRKNPSWESLTNRGRFSRAPLPPRLSDSLQDQIAELPLLCLKHRQGFPLLAYLFHQSSWKGGDDGEELVGKVDNKFVCVCRSCPGALCITQHCREVTCA